MVPTTKVEKLEQARPDVLPADFAAWDESQDAPIVLPDDFNGFDTAEQKTSSRNKNIRDESIESARRKASSETDNSVSEAASKIHSDRQWKSYIHARGAEKKDEKSSDDQAQVENTIAEDLVFSSTDVFSGRSRIRMGAICASAALLLGMFGAYMVRHFKSTPHREQVSVITSRSSAYDDKNGSLKEEPAIANYESNKETSAPDASRKEIERPASDISQPQNVVARPDIHVTTLPQMNTTSQITPRLNHSGNEKEPGGQISMPLNGDYGASYTHESHPVVQLAVPSQVSVSMPKSFSMATYHPEPTYPEIAKRARMEGEVEVRVIVSKSGEVKNASIVSGPKMLQAAAMETVKKWRYQPYKMNNQVVEMSTTVRFSFHLKQ